MPEHDLTILDSFYQEVQSLLVTARSNVRTAVNTTMVSTYWQIGCLIVEEEQRGAERADYGKQLLSSLSKKLTVDFGKGFGETNLKQMRLFYKVFPIRHALSDEFTTSSKSPPPLRFFTQ